MRLKISLSASEYPIPFNYQYWLVGAFHGWIGHDTQFHDKISLYSLSWLDGGKKINDKLQFRNGATWYVSIYLQSYIDKFVNSALSAPEIFGGMRVVKVEQESVPSFGTKYLFKAGSPVLIKGDGRNCPAPHYLYNDEISNQLMTNILRAKMNAANEWAAGDFTNEDKRVSVQFDLSFEKPKIKLTTIKSLSYKGSICPVIIEGTSKALQFAYDVGIGNNTGLGFGFLKTF